MKIVFDKENCIGCGSCVSICPSFWEMGDDGKAALKGSKDGKSLEIEEEGCNLDAVEICPTGVIKIEK